MSKPLLVPQGDFPPVGLGRRLAAMFYDFAVHGTADRDRWRLQDDPDGDHRRSTHARADRGRCAGWRSATVDATAVCPVRLFCQVLDPWRPDPGHAGVGVRVQNADGTAISLWQALLRFVVSIASWLCLGLGFFWALIDKRKRGWHDIYSESQLVRVPKQKK